MDKTDGASSIIVSGEDGLDRSRFARSARPVMRIGCTWIFAPYPLVRLPKTTPNLSLELLKDATTGYLELTRDNIKIVQSQMSLPPVKRSNQGESSSPNPIPPPVVSAKPTTEVALFATETDGHSDTESSSQVVIPRSNLILPPRIASSGTNNSVLALPHYVSRDLDGSEEKRELVISISRSRASELFSLLTVPQEEVGVSDDDLPVATGSMDSSADSTTSLKIDILGGQQREIVAENGSQITETRSASSNTLVADLAESSVPKSLSPPEPAKTSEVSLPQVRSLLRSTTSLSAIETQVSGFESSVAFAFLPPHPLSSPKAPGSRSTDVSRDELGSVRVVDDLISLFSLVQIPSVPDVGLRTGEDVTEEALAPETEKLIATWPVQNVLEIFMTPVTPDGTRDMVVRYYLSRDLDGSDATGKVRLTLPARAAPRFVATLPTSVRRTAVQSTASLYSTSSSKKRGPTRAKTDSVVGSGSDKHQSGRGRKKHIERLQSRKVDSQVSPPASPGRTSGSSAFRGDTSPSRVDEPPTPTSVSLRISSKALSSSVLSALPPPQTRDSSPSLNTASRSASTPTQSSNGEDMEGQLETSAQSTISDSPAEFDDSDAPTTPIIMVPAADGSGGTIPAAKVWTLSDPKVVGAGLWRHATFLLTVTPGAEQAVEDHDLGLIAAAGGRRMRFADFDAFRHTVVKHLTKINRVEGAHGSDWAIPSAGPSAMDPIRSDAASIAPSISSIPYPRRLTRRMTSASIASVRSTVSAFSIKTAQTSRLLGSYARSILDQDVGSALLPVVAEAEIVPNLPPKTLVRSFDTHFLEERRAALELWMNQVWWTVVWRSGLEGWVEWRKFAGI
ncbi:hypothetical protein M427DRAFT_140615 [Gonapodya prolifera JEL478]|uniref:PX domain-containing protein n=1 Tax=Gonapodya prolifera (strain JEL478) TaxID=1344416 RepID=A0A138ZZU5_GONPJ|nr:hypothetical protein M427DRAFT_140615 [Gonapodya prolifera JEL478]|eukprot:KXS09663.1 hypothetical protein M427DRAFT_140615 [Gonapodya prolifera JEL478]